MAWTVDISDRQSVGVSDTELVDHLFASIEDLSSPTCIVGSRKVETLEAAARSSLAVTTPPHGETIVPVTADRLTDVPAWLKEAGGPAVVLCYLTLWRREATESVLGDLREAAFDGTRLVFVEPTLGLSWGSLIQRLCRPMFMKRLGLSFHRDIPQFLRGAGWEPTTVNRVSVGLPASVMTFVVGEARFYSA